MIKNSPPPELFQLTAETETLSKSLYKNTIIKCLVVPYHSYREMEYCFKSDDRLYLFPERDGSYMETTQFILSIVGTSFEEVRIITASQNIVLDLPSELIRIFTVREEIVECYTKTFGANIHCVKAEVLENSTHQIGEYARQQYVGIINEIINAVNEIVNKSILEDPRIDDLVMKIELIGEDIIRTKLMSMLEPVMSKKKQIQYLEKKIAELDSK